MDTQSILVGIAFFAFAGAAVYLLYTKVMKKNGDAKDLPKL